MSLQEEIENHLLKHYNAPIDKNASYLINKILDAADTTAKELIDPQGYVPYWKFRDAINKLRGEK